MVKLESTLTDTQEALKDRNEQLGETELRLARIEKSWEKLNAQLFTLKMMCNDLQDKYSGLSKELEELEFDFADADLHIFNRMRELKEEMIEKDTDISRKVKELQTQLEQCKRVPDGPRANEVTRLKAQMKIIEKRIERVQSKSTGNTQESADEAVAGLINKFDKHYGGPQMDEIADLTTARFRENRPGAVWVSEIWKVLDELEYKRLSSVVKESEIKEKRARVVLESEIRTKAGETQQTEIFYLIQKGGGWFIDELVVADDKVGLSPLHP